MTKANLSSSLRASQDIARDPQHAIVVAKQLLQSIPAPGGTDTGQGSMQGTLQQLGYHYVRLLILRAAMRPFLCASNIKQDACVPSDGSSTQNLRNEMRACAYQFMTLIKDLNPNSTHGFWPPWCPTAVSTLCYALLSGVVSSSTEGEALEWINLLQAVRRELRMKASALPILRLGLLRIDSIFWRGLENVFCLDHHVQTAVHASLGT